METITFDLPRDVTRIWDLEVPVINDVKENTLKIFLTSGIAEPHLYNEACYFLRNADEECTAYVYLNTPGGMIDSAFMITDAIKNSKAKVIACLSGTVASAGTLITMACDEIQVTPHVSFMIHNYSAGMVGKGHEMKARQKFVDEHLNNAFKDYYNGFLSEEEMDKVIEGTDMWMGTDEVLERWQARLDKESADG